MRDSHAFNLVDGHLEETIVNGLAALTKINWKSLPMPDVVQILYLVRACKLRFLKGEVP